MIESRTGPNLRSRTKATTLEGQSKQSSSTHQKSHENQESNKSKSKETPKAEKTKASVEKTSVYLPPAMRTRSDKETKLVKSKVRFELSDDESDKALDKTIPLPDDSANAVNDSDSDDQEEEEFIRPIIQDRSYTELDEATRYILSKEDPVEIPKKRESRAEKEKTVDPRPFDAVTPIRVEPIPRNTPKSVKTSTSYNKENQPKFQLRPELYKDGTEEEIADRIFKNKVELSAAELSQISPKVRKILMRKMQNKRVQPQNRLSETVYMSTLAEDGVTEVDCKPQRIMTKYIRAEDLFLPDEDVFMVLEHDVGHMKAGSIVQRDPVEVFRNDLADDDEKKKLTVVASTGNGLRSVFPIINGQDVEVEATLDSGAQIVAMDLMVVIGLNLSWDPDFVITMQDVHGGLERTSGLVRNAPFRFGDITVYLQVHVQNRAPFMCLLGRPFDVLTESNIKNYGNGDQEITITCPNTGKRCTMGTFERGKNLPKKLKIDTSRYEEPLHKNRSKIPKLEEVEDGVEEVNFQTSKI